ncbi:hypothetical protein GMRT_14219 [Giardia muris]|uniref:Uncharacterized protein n=1 Tax=Giardia muris TaxID=5742 RepID=A0A4Z1SWQ1_GIAMU|nr:hypothetical protein GMRT_14219 [Giardia muris]|eukprot:TNJ30242.1 hypothetical protein GMRT_14219 [Giardia muris]
MQTLELGLRHALLLRPPDPARFLETFFTSLIQGRVPLGVILDLLARLPVASIDIFGLYASRLYSLLRPGGAYVECLCNALSYRLLTHGLLDGSRVLPISQPTLHKLLSLCLVTGPADFSTFLARTRAAFLINKLAHQLLDVLESCVSGGLVPGDTLDALLSYSEAAADFSLSFRAPSPTELADALESSHGSRGVPVSTAVEALLKVALRTESLIANVPSDERYREIALDLVCVSSDFWSLTACE